MYLDLSISLCTTKQNTNKENISVCTVYNVSVIIKKPSLIIKKTALQLMVQRL